MPIEQSHGKARPTLSRSSDLATVPPPEAERPAQRDAQGRFTGGNALGRGKGAKRAIARMLGTTAADPVATEVTSAARIAYRAKLAELPNRGPTVSTLVATSARHDALCAFWNQEAARRGLATEEGMTAQAEATKHDQRSERLMVTAIDIATKLSRRESEPVDVLAAFMPPKASEIGSPPGPPSSAPRTLSDSSRGES